MSVIDWLVAIGILAAFVALIVIDSRSHRPRPFYESDWSDPGD